MTNPNDPAFLEKKPTENRPNYHTFGLSKREYFAAAAIPQIKLTYMNSWSEQYAEEVATISVSMADALIAALNRGETK